MSFPKSRNLKNFQLISRLLKWTGRNWWTWWKGTTFTAISSKMFPRICLSSFSLDSIIAFPMSSYSWRTSPSIADTKPWFRLHFTKETEHCDNLTAFTFCWKTDLRNNVIYLIYDYPGLSNVLFKFGNTKIQFNEFSGTVHTWWRKSLIWTRHLFPNFVVNSPWDE